MPNPLLSFAGRAARILPASVKCAFYRLGPLTRLLRDALNRAAPVGISQVQIAAGPLEGLVMALDMQVEKDYWLGTYEPDLAAAIAHFAKPGTIAYDVGANVGYNTLVLGRALGLNGQVFSFEALPENISRLKQNAALNSDVCRFTVIEKAVSDKPGEITFLVHDSDDMGKLVGSAGREEDYQQSITVTATSLDDFIYQQGNPPPSLVKMDIEGGEVLALPGMQRMLAEIQPVVLVELHGPESARAAWEMLLANSYTIHYMQAGYPQVDKLDALDWKAYLIGVPKHG
jgi:FkbM family methyltransferase